MLLRSLANFRNSVLLMNLKILIPFYLVQSFKNESKLGAVHCRLWLSLTQIHLVRPVLPAIRELMEGILSGWWRILLQMGLCNDSVSIRRLVLYFILSGTQLEDFSDGFDFCLEDLLVFELDSNPVYHKHR